MLLAPFAHAPKTIAIPAAAAGVAPIWMRQNPLTGGLPITALSAGAGAPFGGSSQRFTAKKHLQMFVAAANVAGASGVVGQNAASRAANGDVTGLLTIQLGNASGQLIDAIAALTATSSASHLAVVVVVNGVVFGRAADATSPAPTAGQWGADSDTNVGFNLTIFADAGSGILKVGSEIDIYVLSPVAALARRDAAGAIAAGAALTAGVAAERYLGTPVAYTDAGGRSGNQVASAEFLMADTAAVTLIGTNG